MIPFAKLERYEGNESLFELVLMSVVSTLVGEPLHIHAEGLRGTGKTTIMRAARGILPNITRIKGCIYNCDPERPHCPQHKNMTAPELAELGTEEIPMPFLEISHSAKVGTVAGSIDLSRLTDSTQPEARLLPGLIPQAHRGILFIDEINRLADTSPEITDILLDVMGNKPGHIQIEEAGLPVVEIPVSVSVWAAWMKLLKV
jgi:magnesium chelatase subunit I